jgi:hypothetical protein
LIFCAINACFCLQIRVQTYSRMAKCAKGFLATQPIDRMLFFRCMLHRCT